MTNTTTTIEELKAKMLADTQAAKARIAERKERISLERLIKEANDEGIQEIKAEREMLNDSANSLEAFMATASHAVKEAQLQTRTGSELKLNFYPTQRKHLVVNKLTSLMNSMVYTREDVTKLVAASIGLTEVDVEAYSSAMGRTDRFDPESGIVKGFVGNAVAYTSNVNLLADKLGLHLPAVVFTQEDFDKYYEKSVHKAELEQRAAEEAEEQWDQNNGHSLQIDLG